MAKFEYNLKHHRSNPNPFNHKYYYEFPSSMITGAFHWAGTPDGYSFWFNINQDWQECLKSNNKLL